MTCSSKIFLLATLICIHTMAMASPHEHANALPAIVTPSDGPPMLLPERGRSRSEKALRLSGVEATQALVLGPEGGSGWSVPVVEGMATVKTRGPRQGGYHWVGVRGAHGRNVVSANTIVYFSNPAPAPREMLTSNRGELDIAPVDLPREHRHFRAGEQWNFLVRLHGEPLPGAVVRFVSRNGTREVLRTDQQGVVRVDFPDDFTDAAQPAEAHGHGHGHGHGRRRKAGFVLSVSYDDGEHRFNSSFNYHYRPGAFYNKDLNLGIGFALLGMVAASPLLRRRNKEAKS